MNNNKILFYNASSLESKSVLFKGTLSVPTKQKHMVKLSYGDCWQQKPASSFATLLLNELNSVVARFTTHESNLSCNKSGCWKLQILTSDWIKLCGSKAIHGSYVTYWDKTGLPWAGKTRNIHSSKLSQLANNLIRRKACMYVASKTRNIDRFSTRFAAMLKKSCTILLQVLPYL